MSDENKPKVDVNALIAAQQAAGWSTGHLRMALEDLLFEAKRLADASPNPFIAGERLSVPYFRALRVVRAIEDALTRGDLVFAGPPPEPEK